MTLRYILAAVLLGFGLGLAPSLFAQTSLPPVGQVVQGVATYAATINSSVTITTGGTFQTALASIIGTGSRRQTLTIQNNNTNGDNCWIFIGSGTASEAKSVLLNAGGSYQRYWPYVPPDAIQVTCATTSDTLYIDNQ